MTLAPVRLRLPAFDRLELAAVLEVRHVSSVARIGMADDADRARRQSRALDLKQLTAGPSRKRRRGGPHMAR